MSSLGNLVIEKQRFGAIQAILSFIAFVLLRGFTDLLISAYASNLVLDEPKLNTVNFRLLVALSGSIAGTLVSALLIWSLLKKYFKNPVIEIALVRSSLNWNLLGIGIGIAASQFVENFAYQDIAPSEVESLNPFKGLAAANAFVKAIYVFVIALLGPFFEECMFRGVLYRGFSQTLGKPISLIVVTLLFVMSHILILRLESRSLLAALVVVSIILMILRQASGSLVPSILLHQTYNAALIFS